tara:strand:+ start:3524 stop:4825 length:1302 start_codon:yes stop_codon:yes gene_type:complete
MALRLRRGTNASRTGVTPAEGELVYTTDTKKLFAGDGTTLGGNLVSGMNDLIEDVTPQLGGNLDLNTKQITGNGTINITGSVTATNFIGDYKGSIVGDDSTVLVDAVNSKIILANNTISDLSDVNNSAPTANQLLAWGGSSWDPTSSVSLAGITMTGNINANSNTVTNLAGIVMGTGSLNMNSLPITGVTNLSASGTITAAAVNANTFDGDLSGSVFADNSTLLVDAVNGQISASIVKGTFSGAVNGTLDGELTGSVYSDDSTILVDGILSRLVGTVDNALVQTKQVTVRTIDATDAELRLEYGTAGAGSSTTLGSIKFNDNNTTYGYISASKTAIFINSNGGGKGLSLFNDYMVSGGVKLRVDPANTSFGAVTEAVEVVGNVKASGAFMLAVYANDSARDAALTSPTAGMIVFNTAGAKFQGYNGGAWENLN